MVSRTGVPVDAWAVNYRAQMNVVEVAQAARVGDAMFDRLADGIFQIPVGPDRSGAQRPAITPREQGETEKRPGH